MIPASLLERFIQIIERDNLLTDISNENVFNETMLKAINEENAFILKTTTDENIKNQIMKNVYGLIHLTN